MMPPWVLVSLAALLGAGAAGPDDPTPKFERDILPILRAHCLKCHGTAQRKGGLSLRTPDAMLEGGDSGPAMVRGSIVESLIIEQIESGAMPPGKEARLSEAELARLKDWIAAGSPAEGSAAAGATADDEPVHWAFTPPIRPAVAKVADASRVRNPIDAFVLARLESAGLSPAPEADKTILIRRATFDLWGLPPTPEEVDAFLADAAPDAYERLIDRLLEDPRYGERWARHWLDLAGYADSEGILAADHVRSASWRYRDWVIRAFNADMPYDRFLREQIAGDELSGYWSIYKNAETLPPEVVESLVATGYLRCASDTSRPDFVNIKNAPGYYYQTLEDTVKIVASSTLGLTLECAKCHSHKYDPITQSEYYQVQAVFMSGYRPDRWVAQVERRRFEATEAQEARAKAHNAELDAAIARHQAEIKLLETSFSDRRFEERLAMLPDSIRDDVRVALETDTENRNEVQRYLVSKFADELRPNSRTLATLMAGESPRERDLITALEKSIAIKEGSRLSFPEIRAFYDLPGEPKTPILQRGDYLHPGPEVAPGALPALATPRPFRWAPPAKDAPTSGRRLAFAEWLTQPGHPLTTRVLVNRLWLHHFGEGIVATPDNFGLKGAAPSHPELLDWLADEFVARGWSIKAMHRLMLTSSTYRQSSRNAPERNAGALAVDPDDRLLWRQRIRRLEAEALRDSILSVAGTLDPAMGGPPAEVVAQPDGEVVAPSGSGGLRRSIYLQVRRSQPLTLLQVFDQPVMETNCTRRPTSTISSQALNLLNSEFLIQQAERFAERSIREAPQDPAGHAVRLAFGRPATDAERSLFLDYLAEQGDRQGRGLQAALADVCQMLFSANEFAYVD
jgi:hypothetical protein